MSLVSWHLCQILCFLLIVCFCEADIGLDHTDFRFHELPLHIVYSFIPRSNSDLK